MIPSLRDRTAFWLGASTLVTSLVPYLALSSLQLLNLPFGVALTSLIGFGGVGIVFAAAFGRVERLGLGRVEWKWIGFGVLLGLANLPVTTLVNALTTMLGSDAGAEATRRVLRLIVGAEGSARIVFVIGAALCAPFGEEVLFRGWLQPLARRALPEVASLALVGFGFAVIHLQPTALVALMQLGMLFGLLRLRTGSLWPAIAMHATHNAASLALLFFTDDALGAIDAPPDWTVLLGFGVPAIVVTLGLLRMLPTAPETADEEPITLRPGRLLLGLATLLVVAGASAFGLWWAGPALPGYGLLPPPTHEPAPASTLKLPSEPRFELPP